jgi:uncharacterized protein (TIGR03067 family)
MHCNSNALAGQYRSSVSRSQVAPLALAVSAGRLAGNGARRGRWPLVGRPPTSARRRSPTIRCLSLTLIVALGLAADGASADPEEDAVAKDLAKLQGKWRVVEEDSDGKVTKSDKHGHVIGFEKEVLINYDADGGVFSKETIKLDPSKSPKTIEIQTPGAPPAKTPYEQSVQHPLFQSPLARAKAGPSPGIPAGAAKASPPDPGQGGQPAVPTGPHPIVAAPPQSPLGGATKPARPYAAMHAGAGKGPRMSFNQFVAQRDLQTPHYPYSQ